ncbi:S8 family serine peptidase [Spirulina sp. 06S082]|uniref:S8 family serine peptidase n=1 Tax=Spirulina sp. 06S082 TaxID=3110248 RepID=UPI002B1EEA54|nr:S8 family serine peptidase [Spirulina sp. 06S082]MEA5468012.1 S8 family serine peptidase [Spirulina sp. 06S082]
MDASFLDETSVLGASSPSQLGLEPPNTMIPAAAQDRSTLAGTSLPGLETGLELASEYVETTNNFLPNFTGGDLSKLSTVTLKTSATTNDTDGVYDALTGQIYKADELVGENDSQVISSVSLTESISPKPVFNEGVFTVGKSGEVGIDFLFDGGKYKGELAIFSLEGMEKFELDSKDFIQEAANRALSNSKRGYVVISDRTEGAKFTGALGEKKSWNEGEYLGVKSFSMDSGDRFGVMLIPNGTVAKVAKKPAIGGAQSPLFSLGTSKSKDGLHGGQIADVTGDGNTFVFEDVRPDHQWFDRDYNDFIFQIRGATGKAVQLDDAIDPQKDWLGEDLAKELIEYAKTYTRLEAIADRPLVGVIDTGFSGNNPDLDYTNITLGTDFIDGDNNPLLNAGEGNEHGTHVLGIIAAERDNGIGIDGIDDDAPLWVGRAIGSGQWAASLVEFVNAAKESGQPNAVVNLSLDLTQVNADGTVTTRYEFTPEERGAIEYARQNGVLIVAAAGNDGGVISVLGQASQEFDNIITVGSVNQTDEAFERSPYSSYGRGLDIVADGGTIENGVLSTVGDGIGTMSGTSVATAKVTGAISQVWAANPNLSYRQVIALLKKTATDLNVPGWDSETGAGLLNMAAAINLAKVTQGEVYDPDVLLSPDSWSGEGISTPKERPVELAYAESSGRNFYQGYLHDGNPYDMITIHPDRDVDLQFSIDTSQATATLYRVQNGKLEFVKSATPHPTASVDYAKLDLDEDVSYRLKIARKGSSDVDAYTVVLNFDEQNPKTSNSTTTWVSQERSSTGGNGGGGDDNDFDTARDLGTLTDLKTISDWVGDSDNEDFFKFTLSETTTLNLLLDGMTGDADLRLYDSNQDRMEKSNNKKNAPDSIVVENLNAGTYYAQVQRRSGDETDYDLTFSIPSTSIDLSSLKGVPSDSGDFVRILESSNGVKTYYYQNGHLVVQPNENEGAWYQYGSGNSNGNSPTTIPKSIEIDESKDWKTEVFTWNSIDGQPTNIHQNLQNREGLNLIGTINLGSNQRTFSWGETRNGLEIESTTGGLVDRNGVYQNLPSDNFLMKAYTKTNFTKGIEYEFMARGDDGYQIWAKHLESGEWEAITPENEWQNNRSAKTHDFTPENSGEYYVVNYYYENQGDAGFGMNWKASTGRLDELLAKDRLTTQEIKEFRSLIEQQVTDPQQKGDLYEELQGKVEYRSQRDNQATYSDGTFIETRGGQLCSLTSLAMALSYLGVSIDDYEGVEALELTSDTQFEDALNQFRVEENLGNYIAMRSWLPNAMPKFNVETDLYNNSLGIKDRSWYETEVQQKLRDGQSVIISTNGHIVRLQAITEDGIIVDDPYGRSYLTGSSGIEWSHLNHFRTYDTAGEDTLWTWNDLANYKMAWIASLRKV